MSEPTLQELISMSHYLGDPSKGYAILGEGNSSARIDDDHFWVKASGTTMATIGEDGFVKVRRSTLLSLLDDPGAGDSDVKSILEEARTDPAEEKRPSVETLLHAILLDLPGVSFVGHTHPVHTNMLLCSDVAEEAMSGRIFPDQIVSMGPKSIFVPYVDPGLNLAREIKLRVGQFIEQQQRPPRAIVMQNHGFIALGATPKAVTSCTDMAEKASRILVGAYAVGKPNFLPAADIARIDTRPDEAYRLKHIAS